MADTRGSGSAAEPPSPYDRSQPQEGRGERWEPSLPPSLETGTTARKRALPLYGPSLPHSHRPFLNRRPPDPASAEPARNRKRKYAIPRHAKKPRLNGAGEGGNLRGNHGNVLSGPGCPPLQPSPPDPPTRDSTPDKAK